MQILKMSTHVVFQVKGSKKDSYLLHHSMRSCSAVFSNLREIQVDFLGLVASEYLWAF